MARKTFSVDEFRQDINHSLAVSPGELVEGRNALIVAVERVLMDTGNYKGFQYLKSEYLPAEEQTDDNVLRDGYDETRRRYL